MSINKGTKNVKLSVELVESINGRNPNSPIGATLLEIYKEYEYLENVARRVTGAKENDPINISEAIEKFFANTQNELAQLKKGHDEYKIMLQGLQMFFTKVKQ